MAHPLEQRIREMSAELRRLEAAGDQERLRACQRELANLIRESGQLGGDVSDDRRHTRKGPSSRR